MHVFFLLKKTPKGLKTLLIMLSYAQQEIKIRTSLKDIEVFTARIVLQKLHCKQLTRSEEDEEEEVMSNDIFYLLLLFF